MRYARNWIEGNKEHEQENNAHESFWISKMSIIKKKKILLKNASNLKITIESQSIPSINEQ